MLLCAYSMHITHTMYTQAYTGMQTADVCNPLLTYILAYYIYLSEINTEILERCRASMGRALECLTVRLKE